MSHRKKGIVEEKRDSDDDDQGKDAPEDPVFMEQEVSEEPDATAGTSRTTDDRRVSGEPSSKRSRSESTPLDDRMFGMALKSPLGRQDSSSDTEYSTNTGTKMSVDVSSDTKTPRDADTSPGANTESEPSRPPTGQSLSSTEISYHEDISSDDDTRATSTLTSFGEGTTQSHPVSDSSSITSALEGTASTAGTLSGLDAFTSTRYIFKIEGWSAKREPPKSKQKTPIKIVAARGKWSMARISTQSQRPREYLFLVTKELPQGTSTDQETSANKIQAIDGRWSWEMTPDGPDAKVVLKRVSTDRETFVTESGRPIDHLPVQQLAVDHASFIVSGWPNEVSEEMVVAPEHRGTPAGSGGSAAQQHTVPHRQERSASRQGTLPGQPRTSAAVDQPRATRATTRAAASSAAPSPNKPRATPKGKKP